MLLPRLSIDSIRNQRPHGANSFMFMQYAQPNWWSLLIIKLFVLFVRNIIIKCMSVKIVWETCGFDNSSVGSPLMLLFLNFSKHFLSGDWVSHRYFPPLSSLHLIQTIFIIFTRKLDELLWLIPGTTWVWFRKSFACQWWVDSRTSSLLSTGFNSYVGNCCGPSTRTRATVQVPSK